MTAFEAIANHLNASPDRKGEVWADCPACGKGHKHFSFSERGGFCFSCGKKFGLSQLAKMFGVVDQRPYTAPAYKEKPAAPKPWQAQANAIAEGFAQAPGVLQAWLNYKRLNPETIKAHRLGYAKDTSIIRLYQTQSGVTSHCPHHRLIVPVVDLSGKVTGFRARAIDCGCTKWLSPAGTELQLFNAANIRPGAPLVITENPIDALMIGERWGYVAVATFGVSIWKDAYTELVRPASQIIIGYDNDVAGNLHTAEAIAAWKAEPKHKGQEPALGGLKLFNKLSAAGLRNVSLFDWAGYPVGTDFGMILA